MLLCLWEQALYSRQSRHRAFWQGKRLGLIVAHTHIALWRIWYEVVEIINSSSAPFCLSGLLVYCKLQCCCSLLQSSENRSPFREEESDKEKVIFALEGTQPVSLFKTFSQLLL